VVTGDVSAGERGETVRVDYGRVAGGRGEEGEVVIILGLPWAVKSGDFDLMVSEGSVRVVEIVSGRVAVGHHRSLFMPLSSRLPRPPASPSPPSRSRGQWVTTYMSVCMTV